jgi:molybdenum cofactor synthesis domain-containing protein
VVAAVLTVGNEIVSGDVLNTNAAWLGKRLESLGVHVVLTAALPDEIQTVAAFVDRERAHVDYLIVTGGLGGTPDDVTREAIAAAFHLEQAEVSELADDLRRRYPRSPDYAARWAQLPAGSRALRNPKGGAPGFAIENVWVLPGLPVEMEAMFDAYADEFRGERPIASWRRLVETRESDIVHLLASATTRWPSVSIGSYPRFEPAGPEVEVVLKSEDPAALAEAVAWLEPGLQAATGA